MLYRFLIIFACLFWVIPAQSSDKKKQPAENKHFGGCEPDRYILPATPDKKMVPLPEVSLHSHHYASMLYGIDVSHYQGNINWSQVANDERATFAYIKASESSSNVDDKFRQNVREARRHGIPVGCYHFFSPTASAISQLENFLSVVPNLRDQDLIPVIDVEKMAKNGNVAQFLTRLRVFLKGVEDHYGVRPMIYTGTNFYRKYLSGHFDEYKFWIAKYGDEMPDVECQQFILWQFSSTGSIMGIRGNVDRNCFVDGHNLNDLFIK